MNQVNEFRLPTEEFRVLPIPLNGHSSRKSKLATCFVRVENLPEALKDWMSVNPRIPRLDKKEKLTGSVARAIVRTLMEEPEKFAIKNQGIYLIAEKVDFAKESGGQGMVTLRFSDPEQHGLVNGGHTFGAIREVTEDPERPEPWDAYVRLHILEMEGVDASTIAEMAEGLNRSLQVDNPSLENLRGSFDEIKSQLKGKSGYEQIAYRQGDPGDIDIQQVLTYMSMLNLNNFPDRKTHPHKLFGQPKAVLQSFIEDTEKDNSAYKRILPHLHEILILTDRIQQLGVLKLGRLKVSNAKKQSRVRSPRYHNRPAYFAGGTIDGNFPLGWLYPMLAAFRANISRSAWEQGKLEWIVKPEDLLKATIDEMAEIVRQEHDDNKGKPAEVGRKEAAYRSCYGVLMVELAQRGLVTS